MPRFDSCCDCGRQVQRTSTSAPKIMCRECRANNRCGTTAGYAAGCKCQPCKDAKAAAMRAYAARRKAEGRPIPKSKWRAYEDLTCDCCGATFNREKRNDKRYTRAFCSLLCRDYSLHGPRMCKIPKAHMINTIGKTCQWPRWSEVERVYRELECRWCAKVFTTSKAAHQYCERSCKERAKRTLRRAREAGATGSYRWGDVVKLWAKFDKACAYCHQPVALTDMQAEHVAALARGGDNNIGNILLACSLCNSDKRELSMSEWARDRERRGLPPVDTTLDRTDSRYTHLTPATLALAS